MKNVNYTPSNIIRKELLPLGVKELKTKTINCYLITWSKNTKSIIKKELCGTTNYVALQNEYFSNTRKYIFNNWEQVVAKLHNDKQVANKRLVNELEHWNGSPNYRLDSIRNITYNYNLVYVVED